VFDFAERMSGMINRRAFETLVNSGAFDSFEYRRSQFFQPCQNGELFIDEIVRYADMYRRDKEDNSVSLFGDSEELKPVRPQMPEAPTEEDTLAMLQQEKELVGMYISSHPLDKYAFEIEHFKSADLAELSQLTEKCEREKTKQKVEVAGMVVEANQKTTKTGTPWLQVVLEDYSGHYEMSFFGKEFDTYKPVMTLHSSLFIEGVIEEKYFSKDPNKQSPYVFKPKKVISLGNVASEYMKGFALEFSTELLCEDFRKRLVKLLKDYKGKTSLSIYLYDPKTKYKIDFLSQKFAVSVNADFIAEVNQMGLQWSVLKKQARP